MARLRKTLPKDLAELLKAAAATGDNTPVFTALDACLPAATGGYANGTVIGFRGCTPAIARWAIARGTDVDAPDTYGKAALHHVAQVTFNPAMTIDDLLGMGASLHAVCKSGRTALHYAVDAQNLAATTALITAGIHVNAPAHNGQTALEWGLQRLSNNGFVRMLAVAQALIDAGAVVSPTAQDHTTDAAQRFEFHRAGFNKDSVEATSNAMLALCSLIGVAPPRARQMHDGTSPIMVSATDWQQAHSQLWEALVPSKGPCTTLQGEVVRIAGRIRDELFRNGGGNWDQDYRNMANALVVHLGSGNALDTETLARARRAASALLRDMNAAQHLTELAVAWVRLNPGPTPRPPVNYTR